ncbi:MAG: ABC transporter permease [Candidatus Dormibacteraeota bacterium]|nr:ABC transporter permease [Candidatus Dormibacteraeota bacterium]MDQ6920123.1 ABC transporter permease [Candidatus Dormibacteraeota bacterium]
MARFLLRRVGLALITLFLLSIIVFLMANVLPGDVGRRILGPFADPRAVAALNHQLGVDRPLVVQYLSWLGGALHGDFGNSLSFRQPVGDLLRRAVLNSLKLGAVAFVIVVPLGILGGIVASLNRDKFLDRFISVTGLSGVAMPEFVTGIVLILLFGITLRIFPISATAPAGSGPLTQIYYLIMPSLPLVFVLFGYIARITRAGMNDALDADYTRTAYLKGLTRGTVIRRHVLRNALLPTIAVVATQTGYLIGGLVVIEFIFNYNGIGQLLYTAVSQKDFPLIQAGVMVVGVIYLTATLLADIIYSLLNPRIRYGGAE